MFKNFAVCLKANFCTSFGGISDLFERLAVIAPFKSLEVDMFPIPNGQFQPFRKGIDNRCTNAVQTAGNFVTAAAELTASGENRINNGCRRDALFRVNPNRNPSAVVGNPYHIVWQQFYHDFCTVSGKGFVNGIVYDFVDQMMQPLRTR